MKTDTRNMLMEEDYLYNGLTRKEISTKYNLCVGSVNNLIQGSSIKRQEIIAGLSKTMTMTEIAGVYGLTINRIRKIIQKFNGVPEKKKLLFCKNGDGNKLYHGNLCHECHKEYQTDGYRRRKNIKLQNSYRRAV